MPTHKKPESERFRGPAKWCQYVVARPVIAGLQRLPVNVAWRLGRATGWICWKVMRGRRAVVRKNLKIVNAWMDGRKGEGNIEHRTSNAERPARDGAAGGVGADGGAPRQSIEEQVREVFLRSGANLFAGFTFGRMTPEKAERHLRVEGLEKLRAALAEGRGAIVLLAHMGPWEALAQLPALARRHGIEAPLGALYRPLNNRYLDDWYKAQREVQGTRLFSRRDGFHKPVDFLRSGGMLGVLADQRMKRGERVPFFGEEARTSPIPGLLQRRSGAVPLRLAVKTEERSVWRLEVERVHELEAAPNRDRKAEAAICNRALERSLSRSLLDGFWFHERF